MSLVVIHSGCPDATLAVILYTKKHGISTIKMIYPVNHGDYDDLYEELLNPKYKKVVFLDVYPKQDMLDKIPIDTPVEIIDHHDEEKIIIAPHYQIIHDKTRCTAAIIHDKDNSNEALTTIVNAVDARDRNVPMDSEENIRLHQISNGIYRLTQRIDCSMIFPEMRQHFENLSKLILEVPINKCYEVGLKIFKHRQAEIMKIIPKSKRMFLDGIPVVVMETDYWMRTDFSNYYFMLNKNEVDLILFTKLNDKDKKIIDISGRARPGSDVDIPTLFKKYDSTAGGHKHAAGMQLSLSSYRELVTSG